MRTCTQAHGPRRAYTHIYIYMCVCARRLATLDALLCATPEEGLRLEAGCELAQRLATLAAAAAESAKAGGLPHPM